MKIAIIGYSGSGKSTLGTKLAQFYGIPICYLDALFHLPNWQERDSESFDQSIRDWMMGKEDWVIDGSYLSHVPERFGMADLVIYLNFNRWFCLKNVIKRYFKYRGTTRPDMAVGCHEKIDFTFIKWVFWKSRTRKRKKRLKTIVCQSQNGVEFKNRKALTKYLQKLGVTGEVGS